MYTSGIKRISGHTSPVLLGQMGEKEPVKRIDDTLSFYQLDDTVFLRQSWQDDKAYASTAGFESICGEVMFQGKPILMVPAHIEQEMQCIRCDAEREQNRGRNIQFKTPA